MKTLLTILFLILMASCQTDIDMSAMKSGQIKHIPYTTLYAIRTDKHILIMDRESARVVERIEIVDTTSKLNK